MKLRGNVAFPLELPDIIKNNFNWTSTIKGFHKFLNNIITILNSRYL